MDLLDDLTMVLLPSLRPQNAKETGMSWEARISNLEARVVGARCQEFRSKKDGVSRLVEDCSSNQPTYPVSKS